MNKLQQKSTVLDVINVFESCQRVEERARAEWHRILGGVANEVAPAEFKVQADPIVSRVLGGGLPKEERQFVEYIVNPSKHQPTHRGPALI